MSARSPRRRTGTLALLLAAAMGVVALAAGTTGTAPPPQFDTSVEEIFFSDAREVLGPGQPGGVLPTASTATPGAMTPTGSSSSTEPLPAGEVAWSTLVTAESLESEVKAMVQPLADATKLPTTFKAGGHNELRVMFTHLAIVFGVIADYPGEVRWKDKADGLRKLFAQSAANCKTASDAAYKDAALRAQDLADLVRGGTIDVPPAEPLDNWAEAVAIQPIMQRMEQSRSERLKLWTGSENEFSKNKSNALREAEILAVLAEVITDENFDYGGDETFVAYANDLRTQALAISEAVKQGNFSNAQSAAAKVSQSCDTCHGDYR